MVGRICLLVLPLLREGGSQASEAPSPFSLADWLPVPIHRQLQYYQGSNTGGYPSNNNAYANNGYGNSNNGVYYPNNGGYSNNGGNVNPGNGGYTYNNQQSNKADDSSYYNYPGQGIPNYGVNQGNNVYPPAGFTGQPGANFTPGLIMQNGGVTPIPYGATMTPHWRGSMTASSGSDPSDSGSLRESSDESSGSSSNSGETRSSQWSSSGSRSGSGYLYPWDYENYPWVAPYWQWWQYVVTIIVVIGGTCCCTFMSVCLVHCLCGAAPAPASSGHRHHHHKHSRYEDDDEDSEEDVEDDPRRSRQASVSSSKGRPSGHAPSYHGSSHSYAGY